MTTILLLSKNRLLEKVVELALYNYQKEIIFLDDELSLDNIKENFDLSIVDDEFSIDLDSIFSNPKISKKPVILLKNIFEEDKDLFSQYPNITILQKPFEDPIFIETLKSITNLIPKNGEKTMNTLKSKENIEKKEEQHESQEDILELTDIVEETADEVSDLLSTKEKEDDDTLDILSEYEDVKETSDKVPETPVKDEEAVLELDKKVEYSEEELEEKSSDINASESEPSEEVLDLTEVADTEEESLDIADKTDADRVEVSESSINNEEILEKEPEKEISEKKEDENEDQALLVEEEVEEPKISEVQEEVAREGKEEIKIPVDEETKKLAEEIDNGDSFEHEIKDFSDEFQDDFAFSEKKSSYQPVDLSIVEMKLLDASGKILEAIEEATVEIARGIAKVTPKIIEEVANEIIPKIAQKIISEELEKHKKE
jgi:hypothetical protein